MPCGKHTPKPTVKRFWYIKWDGDRVSFLLRCYTFSVLLITSDRGSPSVHFPHPCPFASSSVDLPRPYHSAGEGSCSGLTDSPPGTEHWDFFKAPKWSPWVARIRNQWRQKALGLHYHMYKHCFNLRAPVLSQLIIGVLEDKSEMAAFIFRNGSTKFGGRGNNSHNQTLDSTALVCHSRRHSVLCIRTIQYETGGNGLNFYFLEFFFFFLFWRRKKSWSLACHKDRCSSHCVPLSSTEIRSNSMRSYPRHIPKASQAHFYPITDFWGNLKDSVCPCHPSF